MTVSGPPSAWPPAGPVLFAHYAYPPNALGYCGPGDPGALLEMAAEGTEVRDLGRLAARFDGAWPYLQLIASCNGLPDPLAPRVVEAYWIGNELLDRVPASTLMTSLQDRFDSRAGRHLGPLVSAALAGGIPHHNFHVFAVYPWLGLLRAGMEGPPLEILDRCRVRWGRVESVDGEMVTVRCRRLGFDGSRLTLGSEQPEQARHRQSGFGFTTDLQPGDIVSLHWDWVCDRLSWGSLRSLVSCTRRNLAAVNALERPGPAVACDRS